MKWYDIPYPASSYTFPQDAFIHEVRFDDEHIHIELTDGRILSVPLKWIPTLYHASPDEREKYEICPSRTEILWDPDKCDINDELRKVCDLVRQYATDQDTLAVFKRIKETCENLPESYYEIPEEEEEQPNQVLQGSDEPQELSEAD